VFSVLTLRMFLPSHKREDGFCVVVGLLFAGCTGVLAVVGQLVHPTQVADGVAKEKVGSQILCADLG